MSNLTFNQHTRSSVVKWAVLGCTLTSVICFNIGCGMLRPNQIAYQPKSVHHAVSANKAGTEATDPKLVQPQPQAQAQDQKQAYPLSAEEFDPGLPTVAPIETVTQTVTPTTVKTDIATVRTDSATVKSDIATVRTDSATVKTDTAVRPVSYELPATESESVERLPRVKTQNHDEDASADRTEDSLPGLTPPIEDAPMPPVIDSLPGNNTPTVPNNTVPNTDDDSIPTTPPPIPGEKTSSTAPEKKTDDQPEPSVIPELPGLPEHINPTELPTTELPTTELPTTELPTTVLPTTELPAAELPAIHTSAIDLTTGNTATLIEKSQVIRQTSEQSVQSNVPLTLENLAFVTEIRSRGDYTPVQQPYSFCAGEWVLMYSELGNLSTSPALNEQQESNDSGENNPLEIAFELINESGEVILRNHKSCTVPKCDCQCYQSIKFALPETAPGTYTIAVTVEEPCSKRCVKKTRTLEIKACK